MKICDEMEVYIYWLGSCLGAIEGPDISSRRAENEDIGLLRCDAVQCVDVYTNFGRTFCLHLQGTRTGHS
jgi:hypothetical protein